MIQLTAKTGRSSYEFSQATNGFDAVVASNRRRPVRETLQSEDDNAPKATRKKLVSTTRDTRRNFSVAKWAINKHLDFVVAHNFRAKTGDVGFDKELESFFRFASHRSRYDSRGKHPRRRFMRLLEASRTVDGDVFGLKLRGGRMQAIEGDRVRDPVGVNRIKEQWVHGLRKNAFGAVAQYAIHKRKGQRFIFERKIAGKKIIPFGYYDRFDQDRGISPLATALNELRDVYDGLGYALAREKVNQLFTFLITRDAPDSLWTQDEDGASDNVDTTSEPYKVDFGGPNVMELDAGDKAQYLMAPGTSEQSQKFWDAMISVALKSLDIPFSFYKENFTNFFGSRAALMIYLKSCEYKRADVVDYEDEWFRWRLREGEQNGEISIPSNFDVENVCEAWGFTPAGVPWWNPEKEVKANVDAVDNYQRSRGEIRRETYGDEWLDMMEERLTEDDFLRANNLPISVPKAFLNLSQPVTVEEE